MGRQKLVRFSENDESRNVVQAGKEIYEKIKGQWNDFLGNPNDIVLEVGCGRAEYTIGLARLFPNRNYIGIDIKGNRIWRGSKTANENGWSHVAFLRCHLQNLETFFAEKEVKDIWVTFPDPRPKDGDEHRRLTSPRFLTMYKKLMKEGGVFHFKTDSTSLFEYTLALLATPEWKSQIKNLVYTKDLYNDPLLEEHYGIKTTYEKLWHAKGENIKYLRLEWNQD